MLCLIAPEPMHTRLLQCGRDVHSNRTQVLDVASSSLNAANCTAAPDCTALNRDDCGTDGLREDNTCGECVSGFVGVVGPHNSLCVDTTALDATCSNGEKVICCLNFQR